MPSLKRRYFAAIGFYSEQTIVGKYRLAAYLTGTGDGLFRFVNIDDLKRS